MRTVQSLIAAALIATALVVAGTHDFECYENAFVSLDRGTALSAVTVAGQPVYTLAVGLGVRLPLHGNLGASPAAALAEAVPAPATHWLLLTLAMAAAMLVVLRAIEPAGGRVVAWWAVVLLFASVPMVAYTVHNDWPETAVTYCALVGGMFAPHAWISTCSQPGGCRRSLQVIGLLAIVFSLLAMAHPGYWSQLGAAIGLSGLLALLRPVATPRDRWMALAGIGAAALAGVAIHVPDLLHELSLGAGLGRDTQGGTETLIRPHLFPLSSPGAKHPFMLLPVTVAALVATSLVGRTWRALVTTNALASLTFALAAVYVAPAALTLGSFAPTASWTLRDPAGVFAVMSGAFAIAGLRGATRHAAAAWLQGSILVLITVASMQALGYAGALWWQPPVTGFPPWNHDGSDPGARTALRGMPARVAAAGDRLALWPGVRDEMRASGRASTDWADAGQALVTAWTKNRTTARLVGGNGFLFDQAIELTPEALCDAATVSFLRLRHLVMPPDLACAGWVKTGARIDDRWALETWVGGEDARVRTIPAVALTDALRDQPALQSGLIRQLAARDGSVAQIDQRRHEILISAPDGALTEPEQVLVLPVAYDPDWRVSSGHTVEVGGLLGIAAPARGTTRAWFEPGPALELRALGTALAEALAVLGLLALGFGGVPPANRNVA